MSYVIFVYFLFQGPKGMAGDPGRIGDPGLEVILQYCINFTLTLFYQCPLKLWQWCYFYCVAPKETFDQMHVIMQRLKFKPFALFRIRDH